MPIHVLHLVNRFAAGGMENVVVQLVNGLPPAEFRHTVVAMTSVDPTFAARIDRPDVEFVGLDKPPGQPFRLYPRFFALLRRVRPTVLHTGNLAALEMVPVAAAARIPRRIHAEHGWDVHDPDGKKRRYVALRRAYRPFVHDYVTVSRQLYAYVRQKVGVKEAHVHFIPNGVDVLGFHPRGPDSPHPAGYPFRRDEHFVVGTVGRLEAIKNQPLLVEAFLELLRTNPSQRGRLRLAIVGFGPLLSKMQARVKAAGVDELVWWGGTRRDVPDLLRAFDCFVLPSLAEGTSCTLQEAMATELPIVATDVGGNGDLLGRGAFGMLVPSQSASEMARAIQRISVRDYDTSMEKRARQEILRSYALPDVIERYRGLFGRGLLPESERRTG